MMVLKGPYVGTDCSVEIIATASTKVKNFRSAIAAAEFLEFHPPQGEPTTWTFTKLVM